MILSVFSFYPGISEHVKGASANREALFAAVRFHRVNYNEYDEKMESWKLVPWMDTPEEVWWGRSGFEMPNAQLAKDPANPTVNVPATAGNGWFTRPVLWTKFYMKIAAKGGMSQESDVWYAVLDDAGQLWLDPDGAFHDPRYYAYADLADPNYVPGSCEYNPQTQVDPIPGNNTQGPYILDPAYFYNDRDPKPSYRGNIFFWDNRRGGLGTKRFWKLGWVDYTDYDVNTAVVDEDWDIGLAQVRFRDNRDGIVDQDEEYHVDLPYTFNGVPTNTGQYDYGEFIYQKGSGSPLELKVQAGDLRETYVVIRDSMGENVTYEPLTLVATYDLDIGLNLVPFNDSSIPITDPIGLNEEVHTDFGLRAGFYDLGEFIYRKVDLDGNGMVDPVVSVGDIRLTPVNGRRNPETGALLLGGIWAGDLLVLSEVLEGGCNTPTYDINVESDIWLGVNPSVVSARLRSPTGDVLASAQDLQKATVLDPDGSKFVIPVTTFHNIHLGYREYIGLELFKDDGVNNLFITNLADNKAIPNNLSDDYKEKVTSEEYLGTKNGSPDLDYGRALTPFPSSVLYYDVSSDGNFGVGEGIYKKRFGSTLRQVEPGDIRLTDMRYDVGGNRINFKASTVVSEGDADIGLSLRRFAPNVRFYDEMDPWNSTVPPNLTYDPWEDIYRIGEAVSEVYRNVDVSLKARGLRYEFIYVDLDNDDQVSTGDIRLFRVGDYIAGSVVRPGDTDYGAPYASLPGGGTQITVGVTEDANGNPEFAYADIDVSGNVTQDDVRLTAVRDYSPGSVVSPLDSDAEEGKAFTVPAIICVTQNNVVYVEVQAPNTEVNEEDIPLTPYLSTAGIYRLTEVTINDVKYDAGSRISAGNVFLKQSIPHMLRMGANGDKRFFDMAVVPGKLGIDVKFSTPLTVERTAEVTVKFNPPPARNDKILVYFYDLDNFDTSSSFVDVRIATASDPIVTLQFTPYRGSIDDSGQYGQRYFRVQAFKVEELPIGISNGRLIKPPDGFYIDPFWESQVFRIGRLSLEAQIEYRFPLYLPTPLIPPFPIEYQNIYDCFEEQKFPVQSAVINLLPDKKCLTLYEQRQPSLSVNLYDPDDPLDVNDPHSIPISTVYGVDALFYFNVHGGGIQWLFTAYIDPAGVRKGIVQVNYDNTYLYWEWNDMGYNNMLDAADTLTYLGQGGPGRWIDQDCTEGTGIGEPDCGFGDKENKLPPFGDVTFGDTFAGLRVMTFGVPVHVSNYALEDPGGRALIVARPVSSETPVEITVYSKEMVYDYNSSILHPPYFIRDFSQGIDYCGSVRVKVLPADPVLNFVDVNWVDHALQYSKVNYTQGPGALSKLEVPPMPFIQSRYNPILFEWQSNLRCYPGGQTHTGRVKGKVSTDVGLNDTGRKSGFNAYPAVWSRDSAKKRFTSNYDYTKEWQYEQYEKLGTEFYPLTDYGLFFILKNYNNEHYTFSRNVRSDLIIKRITINGPFMRPKIIGIESQGHITHLYNKYNELSKVPVQYDYSGEIIVDETNFTLYESLLQDFSNITNPLFYTEDRIIYTYEDWNPILRYNKRLDYSSAAADAQITQTTPNCFIFDEIIPINRGKITIKVELQNGVIRTFEDCCEVREDGFTVHALDLKTDKTQFLPDVDQKVRVTLGEYEPKGYDPSYTDTIKECNNAVVVVWQDRGVYNPRTKAYDGAGDGWLTRPPRSSIKTELGFQFDKDDDINGDGKVSFGDFETEVCGTYDLATNTWVSGIVDARTWNRNNGIYDFEFSANLNNQITTVGLDFGGGPIKGNISPPDHVIDIDELLPVTVTAYKYGDDNDDRGFTPFYDVYLPYQFSHEVYLSAQTKIDVAPANDLIVSASPEPLTAGTTPELVDPQSPLTITVLDADGNPVDLSYGVPDSSGERMISDLTVWNELIHDPHPDNRDFYGKNARLPQYYWLRTDLQNNDNTTVCNMWLYSDGKNPFAPIEIDFREKDKGKYVFKGFCANDEGSFDVFVFTPDRKHIGKTTVKVVLPDVSYKVVNTDDPAGREFDVPSDPDFTLTAGDNRLYRITAYVKNAQGIPMKGAGSDISVCGGSATETARFTILSTAPYNFAWAYDQPDFVGGSYAPAYSIGVRSYVLLYGGDSGNDSFAPLRAGIDLNRNGKIDEINKEIFSIGGFRYYYYNYYSTSGSRFLDYGHWTYYNTRNWMWEDGRFETRPLHLIYPEPAVDKWERYWYPNTSIRLGYGLGAIYNSPHRFGYCFVDMDKDKKLTYRDSLNLDKEGKVTFYLYAEDITSIGGLIGNNRYSNNEYSSDLYGNPVEYSAESPQKTDRRFFNRWQIYEYCYHYYWCYYYCYRYNYFVTCADNTYRLDWDAMPNRYLELKPPSLDLYDAETGVALGKEILSPDAYDLSYGKSNSILIRAYPADRRDLPLQEGASIVLDSEEYFPLGVWEGSIFGPQHETTIYGNIYTSASDPKAKETVITYTPTGFGEKQAYLQYWNRNTRFIYPNFYMVGGAASLDVAKGITIEIRTDEVLKSGVSGRLIVYVKEAGSKAPVPGAKVTISGVGITDSKIADAQGKAEFSLTPKAKGIIVIKAEIEGMISGVRLIGVEEDVTPQFIDLDPFDIVPESNTVIISGRVKPGSIVTINNEPVSIDENGRFKYEGKLIDTFTTFEIVAKDPAGKIAKRIITVEKPSANLSVLLDIPDKLVEAKEFTVKGKVVRERITEDNPNRAMWVFVNGVEAKVVPDAKYVEFNFEAIVPVSYGKNRIEINVRTAEGYVKKVFEIDNYHRTTIDLQIDNDIAYIDGNPKKIDAKPYISHGRTFVPLRIIAEGFGAEVIWVPETKGINITLGDKVISMQIGSTKAIINNKVVNLDAPPEIKQGRTFVPIRFVSEALGASVSWNEKTRTVTITRLYLD